MLIALLAVVNGAVLKTPERSPAKPALRLRGGIAGVDADLVAKGLLVLQSVNSGFVTLAPKPAAEAYGLKGSTELQEAFIENMGFLLVGLCIAGFCALDGMPVGKTTAISLIPPLINIVKWLLNGTGKKLGIPDAGNIMNGGIMAVSIGLLFSGTGDPILIAKVLSGWWAFNGLIASLVPDKLAGGYGLKEMDQGTTGLMQSFGGFLANWAVFTFCYASGKSAAFSFGAALLPGTLVAIDQLFGRKLGATVDLGPQLFWIGTSLAAAAFTTM